MKRADDGAVGCTTGARSLAHDRKAQSCWISRTVVVLSLLAAPAFGRPADLTSVDGLSPHSVAEWQGDGSTIPMRRVARGDRVRALPIADAQLKVSYLVNGRTWTVEDYMRAYNVSGLMVLKDGQVVLERYGSGRPPTGRWASMSVAKSVTSLLAGAAIEDGKLALSDPIIKFLPELKGSAYDGVTVRQLLMMSSGVRWNENYSDPGSDLAKFYAKSAHEEALLSYLSALPRAHAPGSLFHYNTAETHLAGLVISRAVGSTLSDYLSEKIWKPYGMERDAYWAIDPQGRELAGCCLYMTLADYARVGQFALDGGVIDGQAVTAPNWISESTRVQIANDQPAPAGYGYFWWIGARAFEASGIFGQSILVYPKERLVIVVNSAWSKPVGKEFFAALSQFQSAVHDAASPGAPKVAKQ